MTKSLPLGINPKVVGTRRASAIPLLGRHGEDLCLELCKIFGSVSKLAALVDSARARAEKRDPRQLLEILKAALSSYHTDHSASHSTDQL